MWRELRGGLSDRGRTSHRGPPGWEEGGEGEGTLSIWPIRKGGSWGYLTGRWREAISYFTDKIMIK